MENCVDKKCKCVLKYENIGKFFCIDAEIASSGDEDIIYTKGGYVLNIYTDTWRRTPSTWMGTPFLGIGFIKEKRFIKNGTKVTFIGQYMGLAQDMGISSDYPREWPVFNTIDIIEIQE